MPSKYRVHIKRGSGGSYRYFDTLDDALAYEHPPETDPFGYPRKRPKIIIQENVDGKVNKYKKVEGLVTIKFGNGNIELRAM